MNTNKQRCLFFTLLFTLLFTMLLLYPGCEPAPSAQTVMKTELWGKHVLLETNAREKKLLIRGDKIVATNELSSFRIENNVVIELESLGTMQCDAIEVLDDGGTVHCRGNVHAQIGLPSNSIPTDK